MIQWGEAEPDGVFQGVNFMTNHILGYRQIKPGLWAELSTGRGIQGEKIFGVTVRKSGGERTDPDLSKLFWSRSAADEYVEALS